MNLNHLTLIVSELPRSLAFYCALGLVPIVHEAPRYARLICPDGDATLSIEVTGAPALPPRVQLYFECEDLDQRVQQLRAAGLDFTQLPSDMPYLWREARLADPDGHDVRLYRAGRYRLDPPWKLRPDQMPS